MNNTFVVTPREDHKVVALFANKKPFLIIAEMGCPALGIWVAFLKQPDALPGRAPQKIKNIHIFLNYF
jgi:hypothetical protein